ncbi:MAG TPA: hypothetical protein VGJ70_25240 [Solirubrobacteraceae bacterium]
MATVARPGVESAQRTLLTRMVRVMFPHESFPDGPYERTADAILEDAAADVRLRGQLDQGLRDLDALGGPTLEVLRGMSSTGFFEAVRAKTILTLYNDPEVWSLLGWEGASYSKGGYLDRGFDDLDWLPDPRIEEAS